MRILPGDLRLPTGCIAALPGQHFASFAKEKPPAAGNTTTSGVLSDPEPYASPGTFLRIFPHSTGLLPVSGRERQLYEYSAQLRVMMITSFKQMFSLSAPIISASLRVASNLWLIFCGLTIIFLSFPSLSTHIHH